MPQRKNSYNFWTWFRHKVLRRPVRLAVAKQRRVKHPQLTVVFLHGIAATSDTWKQLFQELRRDKTFEKVDLIALDLLGFGKSLRADWLKYDYPEYDKAIDYTLKKLRIKTPVVLVGHSMGSLIAANYVTNFQPSVDVQQLLLASPPVLMAAELANLPDKFYASAFSSLQEKAKNVPAVSVFAGMIQHVSNFRRSYLSTVAFQRSMENIVLNRGNYSTFTHLATPTLLLHGHFDPLVLGSNLRRVAAHNPKYVKYQSVIGHHDISPGKRSHIISSLRKIVKDLEEKHE